MAYRDFAEGMYLSTCAFPFRKYVFTGDRSAQGSVGVWSLYIHKVRHTEKKPTATFLQASVDSFITDWISAGRDELVRWHVRDVMLQSSFVKE